MADVLIRGMEMPKCCCVCPCFNDEYCYCQAADKDLGSVLIDRRHPDCPLIEVPPHGDLIDKDEIMNEILEERGEDNACWFAGIVNDIPTVIPADKDGET